MKLVDPQQLLAQLHVAVKQRKAFMDRIDQVGINFLRNIVAVKEHFQNGRIFPHLGVKHVLVHVGAQCSRDRVLLLAVSFVDRFESPAPDVTVRILQKLNIAAVGQFHFFPVFIFNLRKFHVRVVDHSENMLRRLRQIADLGEQGFLCLTEDMGFFPFDFLQGEFIVGQIRVFDQRVQFVLRQRQNFRCNKG
ncbi:hypothetical protein D1872_259920 [compost metagenome]